MSVCIVNLSALDSESDGELSRAVRELCVLLFDLSQEQPSFHPIFVVGDTFASRFAGWIDREPVIIPVNPLHPSRPLLRGLNPDLIISPIFGVGSFDQIEEFKVVRRIAVMSEALALESPEPLPSNLLDQQRSTELLRSAYRVITLSEDVRSQLILDLQLPPESVVAIPLDEEIADSGERGEPQIAPWPLTRMHEQYRQFLSAAAPDVFGPAAAANQPTVLLPLALLEIEALSWGSRFSIANSPSTPLEADLSAQFQYMELLLQQEKQTPLRHIPVLGLFIRALIRLRNIGRYWRASNIVAQEIIRRQSVLIGNIAVTGPNSEETRSSGP